MRQVKAGDRPTAEQRLLTAWATHESLVRNDSVGHYGNIEMALASIRIAAARKPSDTKEWKAALDQFDTAVQSFLDGKQVQAKKTGLQSLLTPLEEAQTALAANELPKAKEALEAFLKTWPRAEGEVRTRNEGLYSQLESDVPLLLARLKPETREKTAQELQSFENAIAQLQTKTHYTFVDAMLVMLREGLEALLIVSALVAFARKSRTKQEGKVWAGAGLGLIASGLLALILRPSSRPRSQRQVGNKSKAIQESSRSSSCYSSATGCTRKAPSRNANTFCRRFRRRPCSSSAS